MGLKWTGALYADTPTVEVETWIDAPPEMVWALVSDIAMMPTLSAGLQSVEWLDGVKGPAVGHKFVGRNKHESLGEWQTTSHVVGFEPNRVFAWAVQDPALTILADATHGRVQVGRQLAVERVVHIRAVECHGGDRTGSIEGQLGEGAVVHEQHGSIELLVAHEDRLPLPVAEELPLVPNAPFAYRHRHDSVGAVADLLVDRWTVLVLREAFFGVRRFGQIQRNLEIARAVLTARLKLLVAEGLLERRPYRTDPVWYEYRLTEKGLDFYPVVFALMGWGDRYLSPEEGPSTLLHHHTCGHDTQPLWICSCCRQPMHARDVEPRPGPGARL